MKLPLPRGPISSSVAEYLSGRREQAVLPTTLVVPASALHDGDFQLALAMMYELHFRGFAGIPDEREWDIDLLTARARLESVLELALRQELGEIELVGDVTEQLRILVRDCGGPNLSGHLAKRATLEQFREFVKQRSVYHLREADAHTFGIPRLSGRSKAALIEIQMDEYGGGTPGRLHADLFAQTMRGIGLSDEYGAFWDEALPETFATVNVMSLFALHRRFRGALAGHLAALEMTSTGPNRRYGNGLRRLGFGQEATRFYDEHVEADAVHEQLAAVDLCGSLVRSEPDLGDDVLFGAACCLRLDAHFAEAFLKVQADREG